MSTVLAFSATATYSTINYGEFTIMVAPGSDVNHEHIVLVKGDASGVPGVLCRVASKCVTSTALNAADCDCAGQLQKAMQCISLAGVGVLLYMDEEGRGNGIIQKVRAMNGKARGLDTFSAVEELGLPADKRDYRGAADLIRALGIPSVSLLTNNPQKTQALRDHGIVVTDVLPCRADDPPFEALRHLAAKRTRGHYL